MSRSSRSSFSLCVESCGRKNGSERQQDKDGGEMNEKQANRDTWMGKTSGGCKWSVNKVDKREEKLTRGGGAVKR